ncbi:uncharacterized protein TRUGW13939_03651 [Talaromyces rugulosus]|uniref:FAD-binding FR-type domain-containing protein n=1 Tax=Talaromyces rugulosus TaxID=121627 RepID=A0A7H8QRS5_TALRU|nr:uncharacterized protein TRUGW13939_03651 [Talaromyces rugulosus]QKX56546.1 hypothetical protein TRUGW13939_03651 [Talaromyces rugulosus]
MSAKELRQSHNVWSVKYFAIAIGAIMVIFIISHWANIAYSRYARQRPKRSTLALTRNLRKVQRFLAISVLGLEISRWCLYFTYWAINFACLLTNVELHNHSYVGKRLGWVSVANFVLLVFLALRNTPLAPLSGHSYEKLRPLHKTAGYTCITTSVLHAAVYLSAWSEKAELENMRETKNLAGGIAGLAMVIIGFSTIGWFTRRFYEVFYMIHIVLFMLILITVAMHRPLISKSTVVIIIFTASMWFSDRLLRFAKLCWYFPGNHATIKIMPDGALRVSLSRTMRRSRPGSHAYLWIPAIRCLETHPFTLVSQDGEFLINVYDGFTHDLRKRVSQEPDKSLRCSVDGPYGQVPDFNSFDRILLVSGGSGASFAFAVALDVIKKRAGSGSTATKMIDFVWSVRHYKSLNWFEKELAQLQESPHVRLFIHVTRADAKSEHPKDVQDVVLTKTEVSNNNSNTPVDIEKSSIGIDSNALSFTNVQRGRPDISKYVSGFIDSCSPEDRVGIGACGPVDMVDSVQKSHYSRGAYDDGLSITVYTEEFGW